LPIAILACVGLAIWSLGFLLITAALIHRRHRAGRLQELSTMRDFGYFYNGYEPQFWWWDLFVKRGDVLVVYIATMADIAPDARG